jgi:hypothetical protein
MPTHVKIIVGKADSIITIDRCIFMPVNSGQKINFLNSLLDYAKPIQKVASIPKHTATRLVINMNIFMTYKLFEPLHAI